MQRHIFRPETEKICHLCGRPFKRATYVRFANMGETEQQHVTDARRDSIYFHHHCWEQYRREYLLRLLSPLEKQ